MSMWELEAFSEQAIRVIHASPGPVAERRDLCATAIALVSGFDVSFTHFRTPQELQDLAYFHRIDAHDHPAWEERAPAIQALIDQGQAGWLMVDDQAEAYFQPARDTDGPSLWFDPTMTLWPQAVQAGLLTGLAATPPSVLPPRQAVARLIEVLGAQDSADATLLKILHGLCAYLCAPEWTPEDPVLAPARDNPALRAALQQTHEDWVDQRFDARQALPYFEEPMRSFLSWWCEAYDAQPSNQDPG